MRITKIAFAAAIGSALLSTAAAARLDLAPASDWELREYDDKCRIARDFGTGEDAVTLWIDKGGPGPSINLTFIGRPLRDPSGPTVRFAFAPDEPAERSYVKVTSSAGRPVLALFGVRPMEALPGGGETLVAGAAAPMTDETAEPNESESVEEKATDTITHEPLLALEAIELAGAIRASVTLDLAGFDSAMAQLLGCTERLTARLSKGPADGSPATPREQQRWARKIIMNYPSHLLRDEEEGTVSVRLTINRQGRASFCEVTDYSGPAGFNETACLQLLKHARFDPLRNGDGEPRASFWRTRIIYAIQD
ncbi:MAG: TonB family protein [Erythrobacter sp.]|uniref:energy transducer TonB n=1 Tax=Erythrobacter sp. TaxID=1042 RepID=UPI0032EDDDD2